jgi:hypothetical protein
VRSIERAVKLLERDESERSTCVLSFAMASLHTS